MPDRVLITGASGFLGCHVARALLEAGYSVRGSVRNAARSAAVRSALAAAGADLSRFEIVTLDLMDDRGWDDAMAGCRYLQHVASPFMIEAPRHPDDLIRPAVEGTRRAVAAALEAGVERIVLTSSGAAVMYGHPFDRTEPFTSADWSRTEGLDVTAYTESKTRAELAAWSLMEAAGRRDDLVAVNPNVILGPLIDDDPGISATTIQRLLAGGVPAAPRISMGVIDVRDVAALHLAAMRSPAAGGRRFLASAGTVSLLELGRFLAEAFPEYAQRMPRFELPDFIVRLYGLFDPATAGNVRSLGVVRRLDCRDAEALLGRPFISPRLATMATARSLIQRGLVQPPKRG